jgi:regulator of replication initiation timing
MVRSVRGLLMFSMRRGKIFFPALLLCTAPLLGQGYSQTAASPDQRAAQMEQRLNEVTSALNQTQQTLERSMQEIQTLRSQLDTLRAQMSASSITAPAPPKTISPESSSSVASSDTLERIREDQDAAQAEIKLHEQTKVETASKYPLRITGLVLFNMFSNSGVVENVDVPGIALPLPANAPHGSAGANFRQTILGFEGTGPKIWGARTSAQLSADFSGDLTYNEYGYSVTGGGVVRLRQGVVGLNWDKTAVEAGVAEPLISPLSPSSYATVAVPALAGAGNLWTWSPQLRVAQRVPLAGHNAIAIEAGLLDPSSPGPSTATIQGSSAVEASKRPGVEGRVSYHHADDAPGSAHPLVVGLGIYTAEERFGGNMHVHSWAATADWQLPVYRWFALSGEAYRGRALGGLGGGEYKDVLTGTSRATGLTQTLGVDTVGGWAQLKTRFTSTLEANAAFGLDNALASNFRRLTNLSATNPYAPYSRNSMVEGNIVYRPKTYLILSPEYRRITTWSTSAYSNRANVFTLSIGYQF